MTFAATRRKFKKVGVQVHLDGWLDALRSSMAEASRLRASATSDVKSALWPQLPRIRYTKLTLMIAWNRHRLPRPSIRRKMKSRYQGENRGTVAAGRRHGLSAKPAIRKTSVLAPSAKRHPRRAYVAERSLISKHDVLAATDPRVRATA